MNDAFAKNTLAPLLLRLVVGAIFLYHGVVKVTPRENEWGSSWAFRMWANQGTLPEDLEVKLNGMHGDPETEAGVRAVRTKLEYLYQSEAGTVPSELQYHAVQLAVAWGELACGALLLLGLLTRISAGLMIVVQLGAILTVTWGRGFSFGGGGGFEYNIALMAICLDLMLSGAGDLSLDHWLMGRRSPAGVPAGGGVGTGATVGRA